jgi:hypothetical protein
MTFKVQKIPFPPGSPRVESGAVQFGDDWPGLFLRGDDAFELAQNLNALGKFLNDIPDQLKVEVGKAELALAWIQLRQIREMILEDVVCKPVIAQENTDAGMAEGTDRQT